MDERFMRQALREAARGLGHSSPNPAVGAVVVKNGRVLARGYHHRAGESHAEIEALRALGNEDRARGATLYVTLEPCSTHGRTPPCTDAILRAGLSRVVIGTMDPNPRHAGRGVDILRAAGIDVGTGILSDECARLNRAFNRWIVTGQPWVIAKAALTLDGRLTRPPGESQWLSGPAALTHVHRQRARVDAIMVGAGTLRADNPRLTVRGVKENVPTRQPWRVVLTRSGLLPTGAHLFTDEWRERTLVYRAKSLRHVLGELGQRQVTSVMIEGGGELLGEAISNGLVDEVQFFLTPRLAGGPIPATSGQGYGIPQGTTLCESGFQRLGQDMLLTGLVERGAG